MSEEHLVNISGSDIGGVAAAIPTLGMTPVAQRIICGAVVKGVGVLIVGGINVCYRGKRK